MADKRVEIALKLKEKNVSEIILLGRSIVKGMMFNPAYPFPNPTLAAVTLHLDELETVHAKCGIRNNHGTTADYTLRKMLLELVKTDLKVLSYYASNSTFNDAWNLQNAGFLLNPPKSQQASLGQFKIFTR